MYKLGFIGGSIESIAGYPHFIASQMDKRFEVVCGVFSSHKEINIKTALKWKIKSCYSNIDELVENEKNNIDAICILTPSPLHIQTLEKLINLNIPIICEKPLVCSKEDIEKIEKISKNKNNFLVVTNNYSGYAMIRELKQRILKNELGNILQIRLKMPQESFLRPPKNIKYPQKWRLKDDFIPMICLDLGIHLHHLAFFLLNEEPEQLFANYNSFSKYDVIDDVDIFLKYKSGIKGNFWISKTALGNSNGLRIEIYGSKASASWHQENPEKLEFSYSNGERIIIDRASNLIDTSNSLYNRMTPGHPSGYIEAFANIYNDIANCLDEYYKLGSFSNSYIFGLEHASNGIKLFHNSSISNKNKSWINNT